MWYRIHATNEGNVPSKKVSNFKIGVVLKIKEELLYVWQNVGLLLWPSSPLATP